MSETIPVTDTLAIEVLIDRDAILARRWERQETAWHVASETRIRTARELADYRGTGAVRAEVQRAWCAMRAGVIEAPAKPAHNEWSGRITTTMREVLTRIARGLAVHGHDARTAQRLLDKGLVETLGSHGLTVTDAGRAELFGRAS